jgi:hypothetical protein
MLLAYCLGLYLIFGIILLILNGKIYEYSPTLQEEVKILLEALMYLAFLILLPCLLRKHD